MSVVVIDHHQANEELPHRSDAAEPSIASTIFSALAISLRSARAITLVAVNRELRQRGLLDAREAGAELVDMPHHVFSRLAADVAPLIGSQPRLSPWPGGASARSCRPCRLDGRGGRTAHWRPGISAMLGPRINAGGRIGRADLGVRLLLQRARCRKQVPGSRPSWIAQCRAPRHRTSRRGGRSRGAGRLASRTKAVSSSPQAKAGIPEWSASSPRA